LDTQKTTLERKAEIRGDTIRADTLDALSACFIGRLNQLAEYLPDAEWSR